jgi:hypothetical protein
MSKLEQIRSVNGDFARAYKYKFEIVAQQNAGLLQELMTTYTPQNGTFADGISSSCLNCQIPNTGTSEITVEIGQHTGRFNGRHETSGSISPEFLVSGDYWIYDFFRSWGNLSSSHVDDSQVRQSLFLANIMITAYRLPETLGGSAVVGWKSQLRNAWCRNEPEVTLSDDSNEIVRFQPEIAYEFADQII